MSNRRFAAGGDFQARISFNAPVPVGRTVVVEFMEGPYPDSGRAPSLPPPKFEARSVEMPSAAPTENVVVRCELSWSEKVGEYTAQLVSFVQEGGGDQITVDLSEVEPLSVEITPARKFSVRKWSTD